MRAVGRLRDRQRRASSTLTDEGPLPAGRDDARVLRRREQPARPGARGAHDARSASCSSARAMRAGARRHPLAAAARPRPPRTSRRRCGSARVAQAARSAAVASRRREHAARRASDREEDRWPRRRSSGSSWARKSDMAVMEECADQLEELGVPYEMVVASRAPPARRACTSGRATAADRGIKVIVAAAGKAAHLGGVVAAFTPLPVITVPMKTSRPRRARLAAVDGADADGRPRRVRRDQRREERGHPRHADPRHVRAAVSARRSRSSSARWREG